ncbi:MAG: hypothetical protein ACD_33C00045G0011 [uncultured bacterium]|nr:MAG: hypothetical protein ACD_33C00045G0011 [uncultured bacterium]
MKLADLKQIWSNPNRLKEDGVDHINCSIAGTTPVGRFLAVDQKVSFQLEGLGNFMSPANLWAWLGCEGDDRFRSCHPKEIRDLKKEHKSDKTHVNSYQTLVIAAKWQQLNKLMKQGKFKLEAINLPLRVYRQDKATNFRTSLPYESWYCEGMLEVFKALQSGEEPDWKKIGTKISLEQAINEVKVSLFSTTA